MKRIITIILTLILALSVAGCGDNSNSFPIELTESTEAPTEASTEPETEGSLSPFFEKEYNLEGDLLRIKAGYDKENKVLITINCKLDDSVPVYSSLVYMNVFLESAAIARQVSFVTLMIEDNSTGQMDGYTIFSDGSTSMHEYPSFYSDKTSDYSTLSFDEYDKYLNSSTVERAFDDLYTACGLKREEATQTPTERPTEAPTESPTTSSQKVIYEGNNIKITYKGITTEYSSIKINLLIENNSGKDYTFQTRNMAVNGFMIDPIFSPDVSSGNKANVSFKFYDSKLQENDITKIEHLEFRFHIFEVDNWSNSIDTEIISFDT